MPADPLRPRGWEHEPELRARRPMALGVSALMVIATARVLLVAAHEGRLDEPYVLRTFLLLLSLAVVALAGAGKD